MPLLRREIESMRSTVALRDNRIAKQETEFKALGAAFVEREKRVAELEPLLAKSQAELESLKAALANRESGLAQAAAESAKQEERIAQLQAEIIRCNEQDVSKRHELDALRQELTQREDQIVGQQVELESLNWACADMEAAFKQERELNKEVIGQWNQSEKISRNWERAAKALKEVIEDSLFFKRFPSVLDALAKFPPEMEV
ncbi:MAG: hypothetical protein A3J65_01945 [Candidatus Buchananbacteria bacterium RIFCSPHIGHO2_02_FULL_45_11b]|nr:MAG: hypothetical protein A3J65_01945 [Candidatus Buchananbacteria bacterium RIFCSPHIGHO2_02_FULL_45_11b]